MQEAVSCPIWGTPATQLSVSFDVARYLSVRAGGEFEVFFDARHILEGDLDGQTRAKLTTWIWEQHRAGVRFPRIHAEVIEYVRGRRPLTFNERRDRVILAMATAPVGPLELYRSGGLVDDQLFRHRAFLAAPLEAASNEDVGRYMSLITETGDLIRTGEGFRLSASGLQRADELRGTGAGSQAFIAMWFNAEVDGAFDAMAAAVEAAGYIPVRIDRKEHNNKIDDEIVAEIRRSRFLVADFTCALADDGQAIARGGVYFEAGFAMGLGIPVIWTCRADMIDKVHFDTRQYSHIAWTSPDDLRERLRNRIGATIGDGPSAH